jgi:cell division septum initiation protein DivIVA
MLEILLDDIVDQYVKFAAEYHEIEVDRKAVEHIVAHRPLTDAVVQALNPELTVTHVRDSVAALGCPIATE